MSKRGYDGDGATQPGIPADNFSGFTSDGSNQSAGGSNFGGIGNRKILNPKRLKGGRPAAPKPLPAQPQAQAQPVAGNTQGFNFTFGNAAPAATNPGADTGFGFQQSSIPQQSGFGQGFPQPQQSNGFSFGSQQVSEPQQQQQSQGFNFTPKVPNLFTQNSSPFGSGSQSSGFSGNIFNIQPPVQSAPPNQPASFNPFNNNNSNQSTNNTNGNIFGGSGNTNSTQSGVIFGESKPTFQFGQTPASSSGFGSGMQSVSAPSSFNFTNDNAMMDDHPTTSSSFSTGPSTQPDPASSSAAATSISTGAIAPFSSGAGQNIFGGTGPQANAPPKAPVFSFPQASSITTSNLFAKSGESTTGTGGSLFTHPPSKSETQNLFASAAIPVSNSNASANVDANTGSGMFAAHNGNASSVTKPAASVASIFGTPATAESKDHPETAGQSSIAAKTPIFAFNPVTTQTTNVQTEASKTQDQPPKSSFNFQLKQPQDKPAIEKQNLFSFSTSDAQSATAPSKIEQKTLPSFSFDGKLATSSDQSKTAESKPNAATQPSNSGLFTTTSQPLSAANRINEPRKNLFEFPSTKDQAPSLFSGLSTQSTSGASTTKLFSNFNPTTSASQSTSEQSTSQVLSKPFSVNKASESDKAMPAPRLQDNQSMNKSALNFQSAASAKVNTDMIPHSPQTSQIPSADQLDTLQTTSSNTQSISPNKGLTNFKFSTEPRQDISPNKSPFNYRPAVQKIPVAASTKAASPIKSQSGAKESFEAMTEVDEDVTEARDLDHAPDDRHIPGSFASKWTTLRTGDLPTDEAVDILLHDWILQLEIPEKAFTGMDMNQRDDLTWLWQQNAIDAAWDYHIKEFGEKDRNILEVFRIVLELKDAVDRYHQRSWSRVDSLVNPRIFDERNIRQMSKRNIKGWENSLKSEIKSLRKRKADIFDEHVDTSTLESAKRSKLDDRDSHQETRAPLSPTLAPKSLFSSSKQPFVEDDTSDEGNFRTTQGSKTTQEGRNAAAANTNARRSSPTKNNIFTSSKSQPTQTSAQAVSTATKEAVNKSEPFNTKDIISTSNISSPQRSKTSQLFESIANKPVEYDTPAKTTIKPTRSLFDRITRDSSGAPLRQDDTGRLPQAGDHDLEQSEENEGDDEEEDEEDEDHATEDEEDGKPDDEKEVGENNGGSSDKKVFAQSTSSAALAREAAIGATGDNTWKPDSPIRFGKATQDNNNTIAPPFTGFVPSGGMPKFSKESTPPVKVSSQSTFKAPANPFGFFKPNENKESAEESSKPAETVSAPKFTMPKPPATTGSTPNFTVSSQDTFKAPSNPFGAFATSKQADTESLAAPTVTLTAPSPQRPANKPLFDIGSSTTSTIGEPGKNLFGFAPKAKTSDTSLTKDSTPSSSIFANSGSTAPFKSMFSSADSSTVPKKSLFEYPKLETSAAPAGTVSNGWLDFTKGLHKSSSPAPSGASVFASMNTSLNPSRATSPAMSAVSTAAGDTDAEHRDDDDAPKEAQLDLGKANAGEENEDLLHSVRAKAYEYYGKGEEKKDWTVRGVGELRVLKSKETSKVRAVLRADQSAKVLLNAGLISAASYSLMSPKRVNFTVATADGVPSRWFLQVGKEDDAKKLSEIFEGNKAN